MTIGLVNLLMAFELQI